MNQTRAVRRAALFERKASVSGSSGSRSRSDESEGGESGLRRERALEASFCLRRRLETWSTGPGELEVMEEDEDSEPEMEERSEEKERGGW